MVDIGILVQLFGARTPKIWESKKRPKFGAISDNFRPRSRIFPERIKISTAEEQRYRSLFLPRSTQTPDLTLTELCHIKRDHPHNCYILQRICHKLLLLDYKQRVKTQSTGVLQFLKKN